MDFFFLCICFFWSSFTVQSDVTVEDHPNQKSQSWLHQDKKFATRAIRNGYTSKSDCFGSIVPPISTTVAFRQDDVYFTNEYSYSRDKNPTRNTLEKTLAALENSKYAFTYASGTSAIHRAISILKPGEGAIVPNSMYDGTTVIFKFYAKTIGIEVDYVDMTDLSQLKKALKPNTKLVWLETPTTFAVKVYDIKAASKIIRSYSKEIILIVENTCLTPYFQKPLTLGADMVVYSLTKFIGGHTDIFMGAITTNREDLKDTLLFQQINLGDIPSPSDCSLMLRSLKTLSVRMQVHMTNGLKVAKFLQNHPNVEYVLHPGLPSHPQHHIALKQSSGHSGVVSMVLKCGNNTECPFKFSENLRIFQLGVTYGGFESLARLPRFSDNNTALSPNLVRLSIGLEAADDLIEDLEQALNDL